MVVYCKVQNKVLQYCNIDAKGGSIISDKQYTNIVDAVKGFLEKYQTYTKIDSSNMIDMLEKVDVTKNSTITIENTQLTISNVVSFADELTIFKWFYTVNGADYTSLKVGFQRDGRFESLHDDRRVYSIGDTSVNVPSEQAIDIAMKYMQTYSYDMPNDYKVSGFNITERYTTAQLVAFPINSTELRPYWNVKLYLNQTYPGSIKGFSIYVWANSGELFHCSNIAMGGVEPTDNSGFESTPSSGADNAPYTSKESNSLSPDMRFAIAIAVAVIGLATASAVIIKKRKK